MIQKLSEDVINQIAAGEVVDRPAHMVKELVENSLDAGASEIEIQVSQGGRSLLLKDNGRGILKEDLPLALSRHATSKISQSSDLWALMSYGFRGEALASIGAVSDLQLISNSKDSNESFQIKSDFGKISEVELAGAIEGTQVIVKDLFENMPARLKFLKSERAEVSQIKLILRAMAIARPDVSFRLKVNDQLVSFWPIAKNPLTRIETVLGVKPLYTSEQEYSGLKIRAHFSSPHITVGSSKQIWIFVQGRYVNDRSLKAAVIEAYRSLLMHGEYPFCVIEIEMDPSEVDVNIHPTKSQVKFRDASTVFRGVLHTLRDELETAPWLNDVIKASGLNVPSNLKSEVVQSSVSHQVSGGEESKNLNFVANEFQHTQFAQKNFDSNVTEVTNSLNSERLVEHTREVSQGKWTGLQVLGQSNHTYIVTQSDTSIIFVDQHAAHERVNYETLMKAWEEGGLEIQSYLLPPTIEFDEEIVEALMNQEGDLARLGFEVDQSGPNAIAIRSAPAIVKESSLQKALQVMGEEILERGQSFALENVLNHLAATMACHSSIRAGQALSLEQMKSLLKDMDQFPLSSFCPHGRPVFVEYPFSKLERDFGRTV